MGQICYPSAGAISDVQHNFFFYLFVLSFIDLPSSQPSESCRH